jgi:hypothetical protein
VFTFTVTVTPHPVSVRAVMTLALRSEVRTNDSISASLRTSAGAAISDPRVVLRLYGLWSDQSNTAPVPHVLATASPKQGSARFAFRLPADLRGTVVKLQVKGGGGSYPSLKSPMLTVTVS